MTGARAGRRQRAYMFSGKQSKEFMPDGFYFLYATEDDVIFWEQDSRNLWNHHDRDLGESRGST